MRKLACTFLPFLLFTRTYCSSEWWVTILYSWAHPVWVQFTCSKQQTNKISEYWNLFTSSVNRLQKRDFPLLHCSENCISRELILTTDYTRRGSGCSKYVYFHMQYASKYCIFNRKILDFHLINFHGVHVSICPMKISDGLNFMDRIDPVIWVRAKAGSWARYFWLLSVFLFTQVHMYNGYHRTKINVVLD